MNAPQSTVPIHLRFHTRSSGCRIDYHWDGDMAWVPFGDPVPVFGSGARAGFHVHDLYHLTLLAETGWSAVLDILLAGARNGVFGGVDALAEEAVVLQHYLTTIDPLAAIAMLDGAVDDPEAVTRALRRGDKLRYHALRLLKKGGVAHACVRGIPASFVARVRMRSREPGGLSVRWLVAVVRRIAGGPVFV